MILGNEQILTDWLHTREQNEKYKHKEKTKIEIK